MSDHMVAVSVEETPTTRGEVPLPGLRVYLGESERGALHDLLLHMG